MVDIELAQEGGLKYFSRNSTLEVEFVGEGGLGLSEISGSYSGKEDEQESGSG